MMRVAITTPTTWPRVRRGSERFCNELAAYLARRGHEVTIVSSKPGRREYRRDQGYSTVCARRLWHPVLGKAGILEFHVFAVTALAHLLRGSYDVVVCSTFMDAYAATLARRLTGVACLFWVNGLPHRIRYVRSVTLRGTVFKRAIREADEVVALSGYMQNDLRDRFGRSGRKIPVPVDTDRFRLWRERDHDRPIILCAAALDDARKGGHLLMRAFDALKRTRPQVRLHISSAVSNHTQAALLECVSPRWRDDVKFLGAGELADLPAVFGRAAISVLPSRWEPFGMVILESMATGTPVVGTRDGAIPEIITDRRVGRLFDPGPEGTVEPTNLSGLVRALAEGLDLSRRSDTADRCRAHAERFSWPVLGPRFETLLAGLAARRTSFARVAPAS
jgi:glycosyltransferase involved in cell wall biosynthesis